MIEIVECEWAEWCPRNCTNKQIMKIINRDGYGSYVIEQPIEENLGNCDYYKVHYNNMSMKRQINIKEGGNKNGRSY